MKALVVGTLAILLGTLITQAAVAQQPPAYPYYAAQPAPVPAPVPAAVPQITPNPMVYPRLNAPLYPSPVQYAPPWSGVSIVTNQVLAPHEMLYPHKYRAMYGPFFYEVKGHWIVTPTGVKQGEIWKLKGTEVKVNYKSHHGLFTKFFFPPR
jgi:hypothetical protein